MSISTRSNLFTDDERSSIAGALASVMDEYNHTSDAMQQMKALIAEFEAPAAVVDTHVKWVVAAGSGHGGPRRFDHEDEARGYYGQQAEITSYIGTGKQHASIHRETIIVDCVLRNR